MAGPSGQADAFHSQPTKAISCQRNKLKSNQLINNHKAAYLHIQVSEQQQLLNPDALGGLDHVRGQAGQANPALLRLLHHLLEAEDGPELVLPLLAVTPTPATILPVPAPTATAGRELAIPTGPIVNIIAAHLIVLLRNRNGLGNRGHLLRSSVPGLGHGDGQASGDRGRAAIRARPREVGADSPGGAEPPRGMAEGDAPAPQQGGGRAAFGDADAAVEARAARAGEGHAHPRDPQRETIRLGEWDGFRWEIEGLDGRGRGVGVGDWWGGGAAGRRRRSVMRACGAAQTS